MNILTNETFMFCFKVFCVACMVSFVILLSFFLDKD